MSAYQVWLLLIEIKPYRSGVVCVVVDFAVISAVPRPTPDSNEVFFERWSCVV